MAGVLRLLCHFFFFFQAEDGIRDDLVTGVQTCALPIWPSASALRRRTSARKTSRACSWRACISAALLAQPALAVGAQPAQDVGVDLAHAALGQAEHLADLAHRVPDLVVLLEDEALLVRQRVAHRAQRLAADQLLERR